MAATVWKGHISFGLISIPVRLVRAARADRVSLHQVRRAGGGESLKGGGEVVELPAPEPAPPLPPRGAPPAKQPVPQSETPPGPPPAKAPAEMPVRPQEGPVERVRQAAVVEGEDRPVPPSEILKGYEYEPDQWVVIGSDEIKSLAPQTSKVVEINEFVRFSDIDPVYLESSYYVVPERGGEKAYAVLYQALRETNLAAVGQVAMHRRHHVLILRPGRTGLVAHTMFFESEVRKEEEHRTDTSLAAQREVDVAKMLVQALAGSFEPGKYRDLYREQLEALIAAKLQGGQTAAAQPPAAAKAPVVDLFDALQKSLEAARKPPQRETEEPPQPKKRTRRGGAS